MGPVNYSQALIKRGFYKLIVLFLLNLHLLEKDFHTNLGTGI